MFRNHFRYWWLGTAVFCLTGCTPLREGACGVEEAVDPSVHTVSFPNGEGKAESRDERWARPVKLEGVPNLYKVSDDLYRGGQPTSRGMRALKDAGVKTIVNLRSFHSDRDEIGDIELNYEHIYMKAWHPEDKEAARFLRIVTDRTKVPVFVHCKYGADRTGTMCAIYRIAVQGWTKEEAIKEMTGGGYGFHGVWKNLLRYVDSLDIESIKRKAGLVE